MATSLAPSRLPPYQNARIRPSSSSTALALWTAAVAPDDAYCVANVGSSPPTSTSAMTNGAGSVDDDRTNASANAASATTNQPSRFTGASILALRYSEVVIDKLADLERAFGRPPAANRPETGSTPSTRSLGKSASPTSTEARRSPWRRWRSAVRSATTTGWRGDS